ncbi:SDR family NAD(P)-dependent oxidoreductase [Mycolicibacter sinensis]|uniref:Short-chain membrane-associated dehydrogenase n=1 Tax=Mycolicibacter sinensis (strain JDM601) TaxID=875328 RepID=F5Z349_MYCSD|nr:SDR family oxidoreductase [Mycolicibacter sinensis]AEF37731.1 short-chain membrane-associated dehydrogenase [Mycolicibacter sinensis]OBG03117.1 hypothetical protein A5771_14405 [Mycolicibacter sinensis]OBG04321.1 hypothetical protein A5772_05430 [Mycolicibacter sinensis]
MGARVAVVTGAASGIGRVAATRLAADGWAVAAVDLPGAALERAASELGATAFPCDVSDAEQVSMAADAVRARVGAIDRLVNAAGIATAGRIDALAPEQFSRTMAINYLGTVHWVQAVLPDMQRQRRGEIGLIASMAGWMPSPQMGAYTATKFAVVGLAETLAMEQRHSGVIVRCVCPMAVKTPMLDDILGQGRHERLRRLVPLITPEKVVDALDKSLAKRGGKVMVLPDLSSALAWRARRWTPGLLTAALSVTETA